MLLQVHYKLILKLYIRKPVKSLVPYNRTLYDSIDLTDYSRLPNGLVSMFASFYVPTFSARICLLSSLNSVISLYFQPHCAQNARPLGEK